MFRGYHQHDTQEFLRCFMDQLHDELREPVPESSYSRLSSSGKEFLLSHFSSLEILQVLSNTMFQKISTNFIP